ncbi:uncharacterized protein LOC126898495 isoform X1 [Daktulosphaira vitifoliae]|uniref:uncharacterized protein LOC126898495 isoform X1 n=2 Tax=Daktulosphaira vitifoliae TaxID=58002 RepID=UPI0021AA688F|nr:uncharacterized protein LOC126898495 isoform X1 [Daktulosphaira vitifoliae]
MFSLTLVKFSVLLFYVILYTEAKHATKKQVDQLDNLLINSGWKNLNAVNIIKYNRKIYYSKNLIETPTNRYQYKTKVRTLTIFLGCTYAKVMNNLFSIIINCLHYFKNDKIERNDLINVCNYTEGFINIIVQIATLMKGALDALDSINNFPWADFKENSYIRYIMSPLLERIGDILDKLNERTLSRNDISTYTRAFDTIYLFSNSIVIDLKNETYSYCEFVPYNQNYLWEEWIQEYKAIIKHDEKLVFFNFLTTKFKDYIKTVIQENYFQLGFKFDSFTEETFLPKSGEQYIQDLEFKATVDEFQRRIQIKIL